MRCSAAPILEPTVSRADTRTRSGGPPRSRATRSILHLGRCCALTAAIVALAGCQSGIGPDTERPRATIAAYETQVGGLERDLRSRDATLASFTPPPATPTPLPLANRWRIEPSGAPEFRQTVGNRPGLTPVAAAGRFLVVPVRVTNLRARPASFIAAGQIVAVDAQGRTYEIDPRASDAAYLLDLGLDPSFGPRQPGIAYPDVLVFDLPPELDAVEVEAVDGSLSIDIGERPSTPSA